MSNDFKVLLKYYEHIKANIESDLSPVDFVKKCIEDFNKSKKSISKEVPSKRKKKTLSEKLASAIEMDEKLAERDGENKKIKTIEIQETKISKEEIRKMSRTASAELKGESTGDLLKSMKSFSHIIDLMRENKKDT